MRDISFPTFYPVSDADLLMLLVIIPTLLGAEGPTSLSVSEDEMRENGQQNRD